MSLTATLVVNVIVAAGVVAALAYVCRVPYRLDRRARPQEGWVAGEQLASAEYERAAA